MKALRSVLVVFVAAVGTSVVASAAYATSPADEDKGVIHGCVNDRTGVLRVLDLSDDEECRTQGRRKETAISWDQAGSETSSGLQNLDQLGGLPCDVNSTEPGVVEIAYSSSGQISMTCRKAATPPVEPGVTPVEPGVTPTQNDVAPIQTGP